MEAKKVIVVKLGLRFVLVDVASGGIEGVVVGNVNGYSTKGNAVRFALGSYRQDDVK